jgi:hypothetical protein
MRKRCGSCRPLRADPSTPRVSFFVPVILPFGHMPSIVACWQADGDAGIRLL